jgi:hypothetical protein
MHACTQVYSSPLPPKITHLKVSKSHEMKGLLPGQSQSHGGGTELNCSLFSQKKQNPNKQKQVTVVGSHVCTTHVAPPDDLLTPGGPPDRRLSWWVLFGGSDGSSRPVVRPVRRPILSTAAPAVNRQPRRPSSHRQAHRRRRVLHCITGWTGHSLRTHNPALDGGGSPPRAVSRDPAWIPAVSVRLMIRMDPQPAGTFRFNEHVQVSMLTRATTPS